MNLLKTDDWAVLMDGDVSFLHSTFGHQIQRHIMTHPSTGLFTCYASRCHYKVQVPKGVDMENDSIRYHKQIADHLAYEFLQESIQVERRIAGHLMVIRKSTWDRIRPIVKIKAAEKDILGVDTKISNAILQVGMNIVIMKDVYVLHYCRLIEGFDYTKHIDPCTKE